MKKMILILLLCPFSFFFGQSVLGSYNQETLMAPDHIRDAASDEVVITKDLKLKNKIWIKNLIGNSSIYALAYTKNEDTELYNIPAQTVGGYAVKLGCVTFDKEEKQVVIAINNKTNCFGMSQSDYKDISISQKGVKAGDIKIGKGGVSSKDFKITKDQVNTGKLLEGVQYIGNKN